MSLRSVVKRFAYQSGAMSYLHRLQHRECLTVLMFHRVLPPSEQIRLGADPLYTVTPDLLAECLAFLRRNYALVSLDDLVQSKRRMRPLPDYPLLITFDDGWRDNLDWALPVLGDTPWTLFVAADAIAEPECWWQEVLLWALRTGRATYEDLVHRALSETQEHSDSHDQPDVLNLLLLYGRLPEETRRQALAVEDGALRARYEAPQMLTSVELLFLQSAGVSIAPHGASHLPLSKLSDPLDDIRRAQKWLSGVTGHASCTTMSAPHGQYDGRTLQAARELGNELIFTSDAVLTDCPAGWLQSDVIARIPIATNSVANGSGRLDEHRIAAWLYMRDHRARSQ